MNFNKVFVCDRSFLWIVEGKSGCMCVWVGVWVCVGGGGWGGVGGGWGGWGGGGGGGGGVGVGGGGVGGRCYYS